MASTHNNKSPLFNGGLKYGLCCAICLGLLALLFIDNGLLHLSFLISSWGAFGILIGLVFLVNYFAKKSSMMFHGSWGEHKALSNIEEDLPDGYHVFTNVRIHERMESDMVVVGPSGVYVLEVKNYKGTLRGNEKDRYWTLHKTGRQGGSYSKKISNPLGQLKRNIFALSQYLKMEGCPAWVDGFVLFPNTDTEWYGNVPDKCINASAVEGFGEDLSVFISRTNMTEKLIAKIVASLEKCQGEEPAMTKDEFDAKVEQLRYRRKPARA